MFELEIVDRIAVVTFTRPPSNWMSVAALTELLALLRGLAARVDDVTVVMLTGGIDGYFVAHLGMGTRGAAAG